MNLVFDLGPTGEFHGEILRGFSCSEAEKLNHTGRSGASTSFRLVDSEQLARQQSAPLLIHLVTPDFAGTPTTRCHQFQCSRASQWSSAFFEAPDYPVHFFTFLRWHRFNLAGLLFSLSDSEAQLLKVVAAMMTMSANALKSSAMSKGCPLREPSPALASVKATCAAHWQCVWPSHSPQKEQLTRC